MCILRNICLERFNIENVHYTKITRVKVYHLKVPGLFFKSSQHICIDKKNNKLSKPFKLQENRILDKTSVSRTRLKALNSTKSLLLMIQNFTLLLFYFF